MEKALEDPVDKDHLQLSLSQNILEFLYPTEMHLPIEYIFNQIIETKN